MARLRKAWTRPSRDRSTWTFSDRGSINPGRLWTWPWAVKSLRLLGGMLAGPLCSCMHVVVDLRRQRLRGMLLRR